VAFLRCGATELSIKNFFDRAGAPTCYAPRAGAVNSIILQRNQLLRTYCAQREMAS